MRNTLRTRKANQGFTLIELLIVIAIIGILAAVLIPNLLNARRNATNTSVEAYARNVVTWVASAHTSNPALPRGGAVGNCKAPIALMTAEGAPTAAPPAVDTCTVALNGTVSEYIVTAVSATGTGGNNGATNGTYTFAF